MLIEHANSNKFKDHVNIIFAISSMCMARHRRPRSARATGWEAPHALEIMGSLPLLDFLRPWYA
jgi:hypothetical protein